MSWSVATVCSRRPSLPTDSQHQSIPSSSKRGTSRPNRRSRQRVVERGDRVRQRLGGGALGDEVVGERVDVQPRTLEAREVAGEPDRLHDVAHRHPLQREQVALRDDAGQPALARDHDLVVAELRHQRQRLLRGGHLVQHAGPGRHDRRRSAPRGRRPGEHDPVEQVREREDADGAPFVIDHRDRCDALAAHGHAARRERPCRSRSARARGAPASSAARAACAARRRAG